MDKISYVKSIVRYLGFLMSFYLDIKNEQIWFEVIMSQPIHSHPLIWLNLYINIVPLSMSALHVCVGEFEDQQVRYQFLTSFTHSMGVRFHLKCIFCSGEVSWTFRIDQIINHRKITL